MGRIVSPPQEEWDELRDRLTPGEIEVARFFQKHLSNDWEIYLQSPLNGLRPDVVVLNPKVGVAVFEVKDWDLNLYSCGQRSSGEKFLQCRTNQGVIEIPDPVRKAIVYRDEISKFYCPELRLQGEESTSGKNMAVVAAGIIFTRSTTRKAHEIFGPIRKELMSEKGYPYLTIAGMDLIESGQIGKVLNDWWRDRSSFSGIAESAKQLRPWLTESAHIKENRKLPALDPVQSRLATERTATGYRRIKGPAGSGKSLVLAAKAARLCNQIQGSVLVSSYNITLSNYLRDLAVRFNPKAAKKCIFLHFHMVLKRLASATYLDGELSKILKNAKSEKGDLYDSPEVRSQIVSLMQKAKLKLEAYPENHVEDSAICVGSLLVDEGQTLWPEYWNGLRTIVLEEYDNQKAVSEYVLVADFTQDLYGRSQGFKESMANNKAGFSGPWNRLETTYRCPKELTILLREFHTNYLSKDDEVPNPRTTEQGDLIKNPVFLKWTQVNNGVGCHEYVAERVSNAWKDYPELSLSNADVTFLTLYRKEGMSIVDLLEGKNFNVSHVFALNEDKDLEQEETRPLKIKFFMGSENVKGSTVKSFIGWEARVIIFYIPKFRGPRLDLTPKLQEVYVGLSRLLDLDSGSALHVICEEPSLEAFGRSWPEHQVI